MSTFARSDLIDLALVLHHETHPGEANLGAIKVSETGDVRKAVWLPKQAIEIERKGGVTVVVTLTERLATEKGLV